MPAISARNRTNQAKTGQLLSRFDSLHYEISRTFVHHISQHFDQHLTGPAFNVAATLVNDSFER